MHNKDFVIYRIMKGHLSFRRDGLSLYIKEPSPDTLYESIEIYEDTYDEAYGQGCYLKDEILEVLYEKEFYSFDDDIDIDNYKTIIENLKVDAFEAALRPRELPRVKYQIRQNEEKLGKILRRKTQLDHLTCEGVASLAQWNWIVEKSTYFKDTDLPYDWVKFSPSVMMGYYESQGVSSATFREIARSDYWRPIWLLGKKTGNLFDRPSSMLTKDQIVLCSFSNMYDSVYEHPESPSEKIIEDDDCLDGWFITQRRKNEKFKKEQEGNTITKNPKIANAKEVFVMAQSKEEAENINSYNSYQSEQVKNNRIEQVLEQGIVKSDLDFYDVKMGVEMDNNNAMINKAMGK